MTDQYSIININIQIIYTHFKRTELIADLLLLS